AAPPSPASASTAPMPLGDRRHAAPAPAAIASASAQTTATRDTNLAAERALLETGRMALARGDASGALDAFARHTSEFPTGQLAEEREVLVIQALATSGRMSDAVAHGAEFRKKYPGSVLLPAVDEMLR